MKFSTAVIAALLAFPLLTAASALPLPTNAPPACGGYVAVQTECIFEADYIKVTMLLSTLDQPNGHDDGMVGVYRVSDGQLLTACHANTHFCINVSPPGALHLELLACRAQGTVQVFACLNAIP